MINQEGIMAALTPEPIMKIAMGFMAAKHLFVASDIGLFAFLADGPATLDELAERSRLPRRTLGISADAMASLGLLEREGECYRNSDLAASFLAGRPGHDMRPLLRFFDQISYRVWEDLGEAVRTGQGQVRFGTFTEQQQKIFSDGVESFTAPMAAALANAYDFGRHRRILDVAGGTGSFLVEILRRHGDLTGTLFELPGACAVARRRLAELPEGTRIAVVEGDMFKDPLPDGHDALIVANTAHVLSAAHNVELMRSMRANVEEGTRLFLVDLWTDPSRTQPAAAPLMSGEFLVISGEGQAYSEQDAEGWLGQSGWRKLETRPLAGPASLILAEAV